MKFSLLIANYNNAAYIDECMNSIVKQSYANWEVVIVDDCSTDGSREVIEKWKQQDNRIKVFYSKENRGCGYTKMLCANHATGDLAGYIDPDDALVENALEVMVAEHQKYPNASLIHSTHYLCDSTLKVEGTNKRCGDTKENLLLNREKIISHFAVFKLKNYRSTKGINPRLKRAIDQDLYYKMEEEGDLIFVDIPLYYYRIHQTGISSVGKNIRKALYWHLLVQEDTNWRRRNTSLHVSNDILKNRWKNYYYSLLDEAKLEKNKGKYWFAFCKFSMLYPFSEIRLKLSLIKKSFS